MDDTYSVDDVLDLLDKAGSTGIMPTTTAAALAVASRNIFGVLNTTESADLGALDLDDVIKRFNRKRGKDFNPTSLAEYGRRVRRAVDLYKSWRNNPADFSPKTRATSRGRMAHRYAIGEDARVAFEPSSDAVAIADPRGYQSSISIRPGRVVTISNIPDDLTRAEADRLAEFIRMLAID